MGARAIINKLSELITAVTPTTEPGIPFSRVEADNKGRALDVIGNPAKAITRQFAVRTSDQMPKDDGEAGTPAGRLRQLFEVQVVYKSGKQNLPIPYLQSMMAEDCASIQRALQNVIGWDRPTTGIMSVVPAEQPTNEPLDNEDQEVGRLLTIPHQIVYREVTP